jgi:hypothetical protein
MPSRVVTQDRLAWTARAGLATRGLLYCLVGLLALRVGFGDFSEEADRRGALQAIVRQPMGRALLVAVLLGFLAYAAWRGVMAVRGDEATKRAANAGRGLLYLGGAFTALRLVTGADEGGSREQDWTARAFELPGGRWLVAAVGVAIIGAAAWNGYRAVTGRWRERLKTGEMDGLTERWATVVAAGGLFGRAGLFALVGGFLVRGAVRHDPAKGVGLDAALKEVASKGYGPFALTLFAAGMFLFGLFCFVEARYRKVLDT